MSGAAGVGRRPGSPPPAVAGTCLRPTRAPPLAARLPGHLGRGRARHRHRRRRGPRRGLRRRAGGGRAVARVGPRGSRRARPPGTRVEAHGRRPGRLRRAPTLRPPAPLAATGPARACRPRDTRRGYTVLRYAAAAMDALARLLRRPPPLPDGARALTEMLRMMTYSVVVGE